jgi:hypothetical protein
MLNVWLGRGFGWVVDAAMEAVLKWWQKGKKSPHEQQGT